MLSREADVVVAVLQYLLCLSGLLANFLVCSIILRHKKSTFTNSFYTLVVAMAVPDCLHLCSELACALPAVFHGLDRTPKLFLYSCGYIADASFWGLAPLMLVIAVNRYVAVCHFEAYKRHFTPRIIGCLVAFCYCFAFVIPSIMYGCTCYYDYRYAWLFYCFEGTCQNFALDLNATIANLILALMILIYSLIIIQHRRVQRRVAGTLGADEDKRRNKELKLMFQFGLICSVMVCYLVFFWIFVKVATNDIAEVILNIFVNFNSCCSPFLYLAFSSEIRAHLPWKKRNHDGPVSVTGQISTITVKESQLVRPSEKNDEIEELVVG